jgi:general secretion pathway protein F
VGLAQALAQAGAQLERDAETAARVRAALAYPALVAGVGALSVTFIVTIVVPRFASLLGDLGQDLPLATRVLVSLSDVLRHAWPVLLGGLAAAVVLVGKLIAHHRIAWHAWLLDVPLVGAVRHGLATARVGRTLAALLATGTPTLQALSVAREAAGDAGVADRLARTRDRVAEGAPLSQALGATGALTENAVQLAALGEGSGRLPVLLAKAADLEEQSAERRLKMLVSLLEPGLIVAFAGMVAFVAAALLQAVYAVRP